MAAPSGKQAPQRCFDGATSWLLNELDLNLRLKSRCFGPGSGCRSAASQSFAYFLDGDGAGQPFRAKETGSSGEIICSIALVNGFHLN
jgi:hypothetical protein